MTGTPNSLHPEYKFSDRGPYDTSSPEDPVVKGQRTAFKLAALANTANLEQPLDHGYVSRMQAEAQRLASDANVALAQTVKVVEI